MGYPDRDGHGSKSGSCGARGPTACNLSLAASVEESLLGNSAFEATC